MFCAQVRENWAARCVKEYVEWEACICLRPLELSKKENLYARRRK